MLKWNLRPAEKIGFRSLATSTHKQLSVQPCSFDNLSAYCGLTMDAGFKSIRTEPHGSLKISARSTDIRNRTQLFRLSRNLLARRGKIFSICQGGRGDPCKLNHYSKGSVFSERPTLIPSEILLSASTISRTCSPRRLRHDRMIIWL